MAMYNRAGSQQTDVGQAMAGELYDRETAAATMYARTRDSYSVIMLLEWLLRCMDGHYIRV